MVKKVLILLGTIVLFFVIFSAYMGMFTTMKVVEKQMGPYIVVYESFVGPYKDTGRVFNKVYEELQAMGVDTTMGLGIYYDDPRQVEASALRSDCGCVLNEQDRDKLAAIKKKFKVKEISRENSLVTSFPIKNKLSYMIGPVKAYPALEKYAKTKSNIKTEFAYELYDTTAETTHFVMPFRQE